MNIIVKASLLISFLFISSVAFSQSPPATKNPPKTIVFYLQDRVEVLDFAGPLEVFSYAGYQVFTVSKSKKAIKAQGVLAVKPDYTLKNAPKADILAFFGGNASSVYNDPEVIEWIRQQTGVAYHFSVCTGAFMLAEAGILENKVATTFHDSLDKLAADYPGTDVRKNVRFVDNGNVITTAGISAGIDGALHLVAKFQGLSAAKRTAYYMEYDNWVPGDGLVLSDDNPYKGLPTKEELQEFAGKYHYHDGQQIAFEAGDRNGELNVYLKGNKYPLFYEQKDIFSDINGAPIYFRRDKDNHIAGYALEENGRLYRKELYMCPPCELACDTVQVKSPGFCARCRMELVEKTVLDDYYMAIKNFQEKPDDAASSPEKQPVQAFKTPNGKTINAKEFNSFILSQMDSLQITGLSIAIINEGEVVFQKAHGVKNIETGAPVDSKTLFEAASLTKPVFAYTVLDMAKKGMIDIDAPLFSYLPNAELEHDDRYKKITARMVLSHTSGLPNWRDGKLVLKAEPGTTFTYSGEAFEYLGRVMSHIAGKGLQEIIERQVFVPFGVQNSFFIENAYLAHHMATGHKEGRASGREIGFKPNMAGGLRTKADEYAKFVIGLREEGKSANSTFSLMSTPQKEIGTNGAVCLGIFQEQTELGLKYFHTGNNGNRFAGNFEFYKDHDFGFVFFMNCYKEKEFTERLNRYLELAQ